MLGLFQFEHLRKTHPGGERANLFSDVSAIIQDPEIIALLGVSGQGKSTLLRMLGYLDVPDEGLIRLHGKAREEWSPMEWRKKVSYVSQEAVMLPGSVEDNLRLVSRIHGSTFEADLAKDLMNQAGLQDLNGKKSAGELSGGEKQRVALVRSMLLRPDILLLDEVTASLDQHSKQFVEDMLKSWHRKEGTTLIWVTHDLAQAKRNTGRVWFMAEATLLEDRSSESFFESPSTEAGRKFIHQPDTAGGE